MTPIIITVSMLIIYFAGLAYSVYSNPLPKQTFEEFAVGGRSFGWQFITMTIIGTWYAGSMMIGWAQMGHDIGLTSVYMSFYTIGGLYVFFLISGPLWKLGKKYDLKTMGQYFELRFHDKPMRIIIGFVLMLIEFPWIVTEMLASGYAIQAITYQAIPFNLGMIIISIFFTLYVMFSGMRAVILADFYQGWLFLVGGIILFIVVIQVFFGGLPEMLLQIRDLNAELLTVPGPAESGWGGEAPGPLFWTSLIMMGILGAYMWPSLFSRIFSASSTSELKESLKITPFVAPIFVFLVMLTAIGVAAKPEFDGGGNTAYALIEMIASIGPVAIGVLSLVILAGSLSMMDSMISSWSIVFSNDVITPIFKEISPRSQIMITRILTVIIALAGLLMAMTDLPTIVQILTRVYQGIVQVFPAVFLGLFWKRGNRWSAWAGMIVGFAIVIYFAFTQPDFVPILNGMQGGLLAVGINTLVYVIVALVTKPTEGVEQLFIDQKTADDQLVRLE